ncbi:unnamed protein product [Dracunculus medinensis]|uniref:Calcipressin n=1 Tax=Dracunculus medinensis TaxID=318479 RepID=A0A0N4U247_DRAME|nr:unnamed protein product [Dracunculus medinensis]
MGKVSDKNLTFCVERHSWMRQILSEEIYSYFLNLIFLNKFQVFNNEQQKANFSDLFLQIESDAHFDFLRSFRRVRVIFKTPESATAAKLLTQHLSFNGTILKSFFAQRIQLHNPIDDGLLKLPPIEKQFLISPPASPPIGWEQCREMAPVVCDFDLMARLAAFSMEDTYEVNDKPKIIIHPADNSEEIPVAQTSLPKTPRPPANFTVLPSPNS